MKKFVSILLCASLLFALSAPAFATSSLEENDSNVSTRIEEINDSVLFVYTDDDLVFSSQINTDGNINFAYVEKAQKQMYESGVLRLDEVIEEIDLNNLSKSVISENIASWSIQIMDRLREFEVVHSMDCSAILDISDPSEQVTSRASTPPSDMLKAVYGKNYTDRFAGISKKSYNGVEYSVYCHETQSTYQLKYAPFQFPAGKTISAIAAWIAAGGFSCSVQWFLSALGVADSVIEAGQSINASISGNLSAYECNRTRIVTVPAYSSATQYWAGWTLRSTFLNNGSTWDVSTYYDVKHSDYDDLSKLMQTGFNNFVASTLQ